MNCLNAGNRLTTVTGRRRPRTRLLASATGVLICGFVLLRSFTASAAEPPGSTCCQELVHPPSTADQRYAVMSTMLRRGVLFVQVDVVDVVVRFGETTAEVLRRLVDGQSTSGKVGDEVAGAAMDARDAVIELTFQRDITLKRFIDEVTRSTERVWKAGLIPRKGYDRIRQLLPFWYSSLKSRGIKEGDRICYRIDGNELHTLYVDRDGKVYVDQINDGDGSCQAVLGGYFVKGSDFRQGLIESLFEPDKDRSASGRR